MVAYADQAPQYGESFQLSSEARIAIQAALDGGASGSLFRLNFLVGSLTLQLCFFGNATDSLNSRLENENQCNLQRQARAAAI